MCSVIPARVNGGLGPGYRSKVAPWTASWYFRFPLHNIPFTHRAKRLEVLDVAGGADFKSPSRKDSMRAFDETDFLALEVNWQVSALVKCSDSQSLDHRVFLWARIVTGGKKCLVDFNCRRTSGCQLTLKQG